MNVNVNVPDIRHFWTEGLEWTLAIIGTKLITDHSYPSRARVLVRCLVCVCVCVWWVAVGVFGSGISRTL